MLVGDQARAARFHGMIHRDIAQMAPTMPPGYVERHTRVVEGLVQELGTSKFNAATAAGERTDRREGIDDALALVERLAPTTDDHHPERIDRPGRSNEGALSERQHDVLVLLASGISNKEIAGRLGITEKTVEHHAEVIYGKLGVRGRTEAAAWAHRHGVARP